MTSDTVLFICSVIFLPDETYPSFAFYTLAQYHFAPGSRQICPHYVKFMLIPFWLASSHWYSLSLAKLVRWKTSHRGFFFCFKWNIKWMDSQRWEMMIIIPCVYLSRGFYPKGSQSTFQHLHLQGETRLFFYPFEKEPLSEIQKPFWFHCY